jgi:tRNA(Glu) U13 pseudouridine synthase TruD
MKTEKSGTRTPVFQIGIMSSKVGKIVNTTVSINLHGLKGAWLKAVDFYISHKKISKRSKIYKKLLKAQPSKAQLEAMKRKRKKRK